MVIRFEDRLNGVHLKRAQLIPTLVPNRFLNLRVKLRKGRTHAAGALQLEGREIVIRIVLCRSGTIGELLLGRHGRLRLFEHVCA